MEEREGKLEGQKEGKKLQHLTAVPRIRYIQLVTAVCHSVGGHSNTQRYFITPIPCFGHWCSSHPALHGMCSKEELAAKRPLGQHHQGP